MAIIKTIKKIIRTVTIKTVVFSVKHFKVVLYASRIALIMEIIIMLYSFKSYQSVLSIAIGIIVIILGVFLTVESKRELLKYKCQVSSIVDYGVYSLVRHPMYLGFILLNLGIAVVAHKIIVSIAAVIQGVFFSMLIWAEDKENFLVFGEEYNRYKLRVPAVNIIRGTYLKLKNK